MIQQSKPLDRHAADNHSNGSEHGADALGLLRQKPGRSGRVPGVALVTETDVADTRRLRHPGHVSDRDTDHTRKSSQRR